MRASELRDRLVLRLANHRSGGRARWRRAVGEVIVYPIETHPHCNWTVRPSGSIVEIDAVERAVDALRDDNPFVSEG